MYSLAHKKVQHALRVMPNTLLIILKDTFILPCECKDRMGTAEKTCITTQEKNNNIILKLFEECLIFYVLLFVFLS